MDRSGDGLRAVWLVAGVVGDDQGSGLPGRKSKSKRAVYQDGGNWRRNSFSREDKEFSFGHLSAFEMTDGKPSQRKCQVCCSQHGDGALIPSPSSSLFIANH